MEHKYKVGDGVYFTDEYGSGYGVITDLGEIGYAGSAYYWPTYFARVDGEEDYLLLEDEIERLADAS